MGILGSIEGSFDPAKDIPSLAGKIILITGGNDGAGKQSVLDLAQHNPEQIWIAARSAQKTQVAIDEVQRIAPGVTAHFLELDLTSFDSIKTAARTFLASTTRLDVLILNAGLMGSTAALSKQGHEITLATNHVGHALFTKLLTPLLLKTSETPKADVRVVVVSSKGHRFGPGKLVFDSFKKKDSSLSVIDRYCQSKLANLMYARGMAKHYPQFTTISIHPGEIQTNLYNSGSLGLKMNLITTLVLPLISISVEDGAKNTDWAATSKDVKSGEYYEPVGVSGKASESSQDDKATQQLWDWTEKELEGHGI